MKRDGYPSLPERHCTGCEACRTVCPQGAISMVADFEGFARPRIDSERCNGCGLCEKICPVVHPGALSERDAVPDVYCVWHRDESIRMNSSSGGAFSAVAEHVLAKGGVVFGAAFDGDLLVRHERVDHLADLGKLRGSKYLQSRIRDTFSAVEKSLKAGADVLFSGVSCQVAGLYSVLGKDCEKLITCSLICKGVPSPKVFLKYIEYQEKRHQAKICSYSFRDKATYGWKPNEKMMFSNGGECCTRYDGIANPPYYTGFTSKGLFLRPSCYECPFKGLPNVADITLADFWSIREYAPEWDDNQGTSLVLVNSEAGRRCFNELTNNIHYRQMPFESVSRNGNLFHSSLPPFRRAKFFRDLDIQPFNYIVQRYLGPPSYIERLEHLAARVIRKLKRIARLGPPGKTSTR